METSAAAKLMSSQNLEPMDFTGTFSIFSAIPISTPPTISLEELGEISSRISSAEPSAGQSKKTRFSFLVTIKETDKSSVRPSPSPSPLTHIAREICWTKQARSPVPWKEPQLLHPPDIPSAVGR